MNIQLRHLPLHSFFTTQAVQGVFWTTRRIDEHFLEIKAVKGNRRFKVIDVIEVTPTRKVM